MARLKKHLGKIILPALIAATAFFLFRNNEIGAVVQTVREANPLYLAGGLAVMLLFVASEGAAIRALLATLGYGHGVWKCIRYAFIGFYYGSITPTASGGQPLQVYYMTKDGVEAGDASLSIMCITVAYQVGMLLVCAFAFAARGRFLLENLGTIRYFAIPGAAMCVAVLCAVIGSAFRVDWMKRTTASLIRALARVRLIRNPRRTTDAVHDQLEKYAQGAEFLLTKPGTLLLTFGLILVQILSRLSVAIVVYFALGLRGYGFLDILSLEALLALGVEYLPLPGAVGAAEAGFLEVNKRIFGSKHLVPATLLTRGISYYAFLIVSGIVSMFAHIALTRRQTAGQAQRQTQASE